MIIAVPVSRGQLSLHFGHCERFRFFHVDKEGHIIKTEEKTPPPHEPGAYPKWLADNKVNVIISGGMGMQAQRLFGQQGIEVVLGAPAADPACVVREWLDGTLESAANPCDH